jgi:flagellar biosynthesis/type III secretory pathway protein FliH
MVLSKFSGSNKMLPPGADVKLFEAKILGVENRPTYQSIKNQFVVDSSSPKDSRFILSEMVHSNLSVEAEEDRRLKARVKAEIDKISVDTKKEAYEEGLKQGKEEGTKKALMKKNPG